MSDAPVIVVPAAEGAETAAEPEPGPLEPEPEPAARSAERAALEARRQQLLLMRNIVPLLAGCVTASSSAGRDEHGRWNGEGVLHLRRGQRYEGHFEEGLPHGEGAVTWPDGTQYAGEFRRGAIAGRGTYTWPSRCQYIGEVCCGRRHGRGELSHPRGFRYAGDWCHGLKHGRGNMLFGKEKTNVYDGEWRSNERDGRGERIYPSGNNYSGDWKSGRRDGTGTMRWYHSGFFCEVYEGSWKDGLQDGKGTHEWQTHQLDPAQHPRYNRYTGEFRQGQRHGEGVFHFSSDATFVGCWEDNLKTGPGEYRDVVGDVVRHEFSEDKVVCNCTPSDSSGDSGCEHTPLREFDHLLTPSYQVDLDAVLGDLLEPERSRVAEQVWTVLRRHISELRRLYCYYARLGAGDVSDRPNTALTQLQWGQLLRDCGVHLAGVPAQALTAIPQTACGTTHPLAPVHLHQFLLMLLLLARLLYAQEGGPLAERVQRLLEQVVLARGALAVTGLTLALPLSQRPQPALVAQLFAEFEREQPATVRSVVQRLAGGRVPGFPAVRAALVLRAARQVVPPVAVEDHLDVELRLTFADFCELLLASRQLLAETRPETARPRPARAPPSRSARPIYDRLVPTYALLQYKQRCLNALKELAAPGPKKPPPARANSKASKKADKKASTPSQPAPSKDRDRVSSSRMGRKS